MTARLTLTAAGAGAIADGANVGLAAVTFTRLALGSGTGMGDQSARTALETQKDIVAVSGAAPSDERIALRADYMPTQSYAVTEVGLFAKVGAAGAEFLCAYWIAENAAGAVAAAATATALVIAGVLEVLSAAADIKVTPAVNIQIGAPANIVYQTQHATVDKRGLIELATLLEGRGGTDNERAITALVLAGVLGDYATKALLDQKVADLVGTAPAVLDTLGEIAAWLGSDADLATAISNAVSGRVRRTGDTMTGALNLLSPAANDDSQKAAPTSWVLARLQEMGVIQQKYLFKSSAAAGLEIGNVAQGVEVALLHNLSGFQFITGVWTELSGQSVRASRSIPFPVAAIPNSGTTSSIGVTNDAREAVKYVSVWGSGTALRMKGQAGLRLHALIGWGDDGS